MVTQAEAKPAIDPLDSYGDHIAGYLPLPAAYHYHMSHAKFRFMSGGNRSSKTHSAMMDLALYALGLHPLRDTPKKCVIWACTVNWDMVGEVLWGEKLSEMIPRDRLATISWHNKGQNIPRMIRLTNGTRVIFKAYEQGREAFQGKSINACYCDEQSKSDSLGIFQEIQARLVDSGGFYSHSMTPLIPCPWMEERISNPTSADAFFYANLNDNRVSRGGYIQDEQIDMMIADWALEVQETRIKGLFASFEGVIYQSFARSTHVIPAFPIPADWDRYRAIDFGYNNAFACIWMARSPDSVWHVYREHHHSGKLLKWHAEQIISQSGAQMIPHPIKPDHWESVGGERYVFTCADHDAQDVAEMNALGIPSTPARKDVLLGIEAVRTAMKIKGNGKPRFLVHDCCPVTITQHAGYRWKEGTEKSDGKEEPMKKNDHLCDCTRYVIFAVDGKGFFSDVM